MLQQTRDDDNEQKKNTSELCSIHWVYCLMIREKNSNVYKTLLEHFSCCFLFGRFARKRRPHLSSRWVFSLTYTNTQTFQVISETYARWWWRRYSYFGYASKSKCRINIQNQMCGIFIRSLIELAFFRFGMAHSVFAMQWIFIFYFKSTGFRRNLENILPVFFWTMNFVSRLLKSNE